METFIIKGSKSGGATITGIYSDNTASVLREMGKTKVRRMSHVEPTDDGQGWTADMSPTGTALVLGPFSTRQEALDAEVAWLKEHLPELEV
jgi:hypothetical protein